MITWILMKTPWETRVRKLSTNLVTTPTMKAHTEPPEKSRLSKTLSDSMTNKSLSYSSQK